MPPQYTPTQERLMAILGDGLIHTKEELFACIDDELADKMSTLKSHLALLRVKTRPQGIDIICQFINRGRHYRMVRLLHSSYVG